MNLQGISNGLGDVVKAVSPHIVRVEARRRLPASGVVLGEGLIATAHHVVRKEKGITIGLEGGETTSADLLGRDPTTDLAILKTDTTLAKFPLAEAVGDVGNLVLTLGRPGQNVRASFGIIGARGGQWQTGMGGTIDHYIENDLVMYPGFSGGALVNAAGEMIGINTSALVRGASLTVPVVTVVRVAEMIVQHGGVRRGYLGISTQTAKLPNSLQEQLGQTTGLLIVSVESGSPADDAGLVLGDTIVAFVNSPVRNHDDLLANLSGDRIGKKSAVSILRGGALQSVDVTLGERK